MKIFFGFILAICCWFHIPVPAPPRNVGAAVAMALTPGIVTIYWMLPAPCRAERISSGMRTSRC
jgi:XapX domain-containing protein